jgi:leucyl aminopeptidase (aminopeptidase T)
LSFTDNQKLKPGAKQNSKKPRVLRFALKMNNIRHTTTNLAGKELLAKGYSSLYRDMKSKQCTADDYKPVRTTANVLYTLLQTVRTKSQGLLN